MASIVSEELHKKMCKKIADLTRVIDKLFRQYYEQNVLFSLMKTREEKFKIAATEQIKEKDEQITTYKVTIEQLKENINQLTACNSSKEKTIDELQTKLDTNMTSLHEIKNENDILKQELTDMKETLKLEMNKKCQSCTEHDVVTMKEQLKKYLTELKQLKTANNSIEQENTLLNEKLNIYLKEIESLKEQIKSIQLLLDKSQSDNYELEYKITQLKLHQNTSKELVKPIPRKPRQYWLETTPTKEKRDGELERLKQEVARYKMELINRETNFNRVFTTHSTPAVASRTRTPSLKERKDHLQLPKLHSLPSPSSLSLDFRK